jgi:hypothetical protein
MDCWGFWRRSYWRKSKWRIFKKEVYDIFRNISNNVLDFIKNA